MTKCQNLPLALVTKIELKSYLKSESFLKSKLPDPATGGRAFAVNKIKLMIKKNCSFIETHQLVDNERHIEIR